MAKSKKSKAAPAIPAPRSTNAVPVGLEDLAQAVAVYERCRYGRMHNRDVIRAATDCAVAVRSLQASKDAYVDFGSALMSLLVAMGWAGITLRDILPLCEQTAAGWVSLGKEPHPIYTDAPVMTDPDRAAE